MRHAQIHGLNQRAIDMHRLTTTRAARIIPGHRVILTTWRVIRGNVHGPRQGARTAADADVKREAPRLRRRASGEFGLNQSCIETVLTAYGLADENGEGV